MGGVFSTGGMIRKGWGIRRKFTDSHARLSGLRTGASELGEMRAVLQRESMDLIQPAKLSPSKTGVPHASDKVHRAHSAMTTRPFFPGVVAGVGFEPTTFRL